MQVQIESVLVRQILMFGVVRRALTYTFAFMELVLAVYVQTFDSGEASSAFKLLRRNREAYVFPFAARYTNISIRF